MTLPASLGPAPLPRAKGPPLRLSVFVFFSLVDGGIVAASVVAALALAGLLPSLFDFSEAFVDVWGSRYTLDQPTFPWVVGILGAMSAGSAWFAAQGRHFPFVLAAAVAWVALGVAALATGSGAGLLAYRTVLALLLFTSRWWFAR